MAKRAGLTVLSGPAGVGKSTLVDYLREHDPTIWHSVSVTTRPMRDGEADGVSRHFVTGELFARMVERGELLEHAEYAGNQYGTPRAPLEQRLAVGIPVLLEIEIQGARQVRKLLSDALLVFLRPPTWEELERRLRGRGTESAELIRQRLDRARVELAAEDEFDEVIVNTSIPEAARQLRDLIRRDG